MFQLQWLTWNFLSTCPNDDFSYFLYIADVYSEIFAHLNLGRMDIDFFTIELIIFSIALGN